MNRHLYTFFLYLLTPFIIAYLGYRALKSTDYRGRIGERFGFNKFKINKPIILVHSVSVGETIAAIPLINNLLKQHTDHQIIVTTSTPTGSAAVIKAFGDNVTHCYLPLDLPGAMKRFLNQVQPAVCVIMETELWPNMLHQLHQRHIPTLLANARMSQKSATGYHRKAGPLMIEMLANITQVSAQFASDGQRFTELGLAADKLQITGSIKFDLNISSQLLTQQAQLKQAWAAQRPVWIAGSTHPVEDQQILQVHQQLLQQLPQLLLIIVPRHSERFDGVSQLCQTMALNYIKRSDGQTPNQHTQVVVGDTMGELLLMCGVADIAFIGGSLIERGGHNPLEPAALGKPVLMGSHVFNFSDICQRLAAADGLTLVADQSQLSQELLGLLTNQDSLLTMGHNAQEFVKSNQGTVKRLELWISQQLNQSTT